MADTPIQVTLKRPNNTNVAARTTIVFTRIDTGERFSADITKTPTIELPPGRYNFVVGNTRGTANIPAAGTSAPKTKSLVPKASYNLSEVME